MPTREDKGLYGGSCNRSACQKPGATWYNHATHAYYCTQCASLLNRANADWAIDQYGHHLCTKERNNEQ